MRQTLVRVSKGGQVSVPAAVRRRWQTERLLLVDHGDRIELHPVPADPVAALRGSLAPLEVPVVEVLAQERRDQADVDHRRGR